MQQHVLRQRPQACRCAAPWLTACTVPGPAAGSVGRQQQSTRRCTERWLKLLVGGGRPGWALIGLPQPPAARSKRCSQQLWALGAKDALQHPNAPRRTFSCCCRGHGQGKVPPPTTSGVHGCLHRVRGGRRSEGGRRRGSALGKHIGAATPATSRAIIACWDELEPGALVPTCISQQLHAHHSVTVASPSALTTFLLGGQHNATCENSCMLQCR